MNLINLSKKGLIINAIEIRIADLEEELAHWKDMVRQIETGDSDNFRELENGSNISLFSARL